MEGCDTTDHIPMFFFIPGSSHSHKKMALKSLDLGYPFYSALHFAVELRSEVKATLERKTTRHHIREFRIVYNARVGPFQLRYK